MKLSTERRELLLKNWDRIMAWTPDEVSDMDKSCCYSYANGKMCVASAMLTDEERDGLVRNGRNTERISHCNVLFDDDLQIAIEAQGIHDIFMNIQVNGEEFYDDDVTRHTAQDLEDYLKSVI